jgi:hypothetical protein
MEGQSPPQLQKSLSRVLKISAKKAPKESSTTIAGSPDKAPRGGLAKRNSQATFPAPARHGGKGIEVIQKLVSKNKRRFVGMVAFVYVGVAFFFLFFVFFPFLKNR